MITVNHCVKSVVVLCICNIFCCTIHKVWVTQTLHWLLALQIPPHILKDESLSLLFVTIANNWLKSCYWRLLLKDVHHVCCYKLQMLCKCFAISIAKWIRVPRIPVSAAVHVFILTVSKVAGHALTFVVLDIWGELDITGRISNYLYISTSLWAACATLFGFCLAGQR